MTVVLINMVLTKRIPITTNAIIWCDQSYFKASTWRVNKMVKFITVES